MSSRRDNTFCVGWPGMRSVENLHVPIHIALNRGDEQLDRPNSQTIMELCHVHVA